MKKIYFVIIAAFAYAMAAANEPMGEALTWDENSHLVQINGAERETLTGLNAVKAHPEFVKIVPDLHFLIKRSYRSTKRNENQQYEEVRMLEQDELATIPTTNHNWHCIRNFQGQQGTFVTPNIGWRIVKGVLSMFSGGNLITEVDYPGFVAYRTDYGSDDGIIWLAIVLRGSQGEDFQPFSGMLGSSWITNFSAGAANLDKINFPFEGEVHSGYLNKVLACKISMYNAVNQALESIGQDNFYRVRFVVTGHSQGGGLAQIALPMIIKEFSYIYEDNHGTNSEFKNDETPRFFGYFMSAPRIACGKSTTKSFNKYTGKHNMIRHSAHGDVVPMLCMPDYHALGVMALDPFYDVFCRSIRSEIAHCSLSALFIELKRLFDPDKFDMDEKNDTWTAKDNPRVKIYWIEIAKAAKIYGSRHIFRNSPPIALFKDLLIKGIASANNPREFEEQEDFSDLSDEFIVGLMKEWYDVRNIKLLINRFALFGDIKLDEKRKEKIFMISDQMEEWLGSGETFGFSAATSCVSSLNAVSETANTLKGFGSRNFEKYSNLIDGDTSISADALSPIGEISAMAIAHFGSRSNYYKQSLFDRNLPSKDINLALRNGAELLRPKKKNERCIFIYEEGLPKTLVDLCESQNQE
ncbi:MAG: hypothetical protein LBB15_00820 [Puniceicoccales bacterium]|jgi:hypothetical protein|nr:hypothetical protein [Puniceicoccales bacterium]